MLLCRCSLFLILYFTIGQSAAVNVIESLDKRIEESRARLLSSPLLIEYTVKRRPEPITHVRDIERTPSSVTKEGWTETGSLMSATESQTSQTSQYKLVFESEDWWYTEVCQINAEGKVHIHQGLWDGHQFTEMSASEDQQSARPTVMIGGKTDKLTYATPLDHLLPSISLLKLFDTSVKEVQSEYGLCDVIAGKTEDSNVAPTITLKICKEKLDLLLEESITSPSGKVMTKTVNAKIYEIASGKWFPLNTVIASYDMSGNIIRTEAINVETIELLSAIDKQQYEIVLPKDSVVIDRNLNTSYKVK
jgi:hypothetical protein